MRTADLLPSRLIYACSLRIFRLSLHRRVCGYWLSEERRPIGWRGVAVVQHSSKGLEFPVVAIPGLGYMPHRDHDIHEEAKLLYVAMTRAMDKLLLTCSKESPFVSRIQQVSQTAKSPLPVNSV